MANGTSSFATAYDAAATTRVGGPNAAEFDQPVRYILRPITMLGNEATGAYHDLGPALTGLNVIPELCRVRYPTGSTGTLSTTATLSAYKPSTAAVTDLTGLATLNGLVSDSFADFAAATTLPDVAADDRLRIYFTTMTTTTAGRTAIVEIAYVARHNQ